MRNALCKKRKISRGFTLVELLVVIAIIAVIAGVSLVAINKILLGGKKRVTETRIEKLHLAVNSFLSEDSGNTLNGMESDLDGSVTSSQELYKLLSGDAGTSGTPNGKLGDTGDYLREASFLPDLLPVLNSDGNLDFLSSETWVKPVLTDGKLGDVDTPAADLPTNYAIVDGYGSALRVRYDDGKLTIWSPGEDRTTVDDPTSDDYASSTSTKDDVTGK